MLSFENIIDDIFTQLKEEKGVDNFWSEAEVKDAANDTYWDIADEAKCFSGEAIIPILSGIRTYKMPEDYIFGSLGMVEFDSEEIYQISINDLKRYNRQWRSDTGDPDGYIMDLGNIDEIVVYPKPDTTGNSYNLASESQDYGVIVAVGDTSYETFESEEGVIVATDGEVHFDTTQGLGPVLAITDPTNNLRVFYKRYPKRLVNNDEVFLAPVSQNPKKVITKGSMAILLTKEGEGKDIQKGSYWNKRYNEALNSLKRPRTSMLHVMRSISDGSGRGNVNLESYRSSKYPSYYR